MNDRAMRFCALVAALFMTFGATVPARAQQGISCAVLQSEADDLALRYVQALTDLTQAARQLEIVTYARVYLIRSHATTLSNALNARDLGAGFELDLGFHAIMSQLIGAENDEREAEASLNRALNSAGILEATLLAVISLAEDACATGGVGQTENPDNRDVGGTADGTAAGGNAGGDAQVSAALQPGFYGDNFGAVYYAMGTSFYEVDGPLALTVSCGGFAELSTGDEGNYCSGQWYNRDGEVQGNYEGVLSYEDSDGMPRMDGLYDRGAGEPQNHWNLSRFTDAEVSEAGLSFDPG